jgi:hypothetical protein
MHKQMASFLPYAALVADLREALAIVHDLRRRIARRHVVPRAELYARAQAVVGRVPRLGTSVNALFLEPRVLPMDTPTAVTIYVATGEGNVRLTAVDSARLEVVDAFSHTTARGGTAHTLTLRAPTASVMVNFSSSSTSITQEFQLTAM